MSPPASESLASHKKPHPAWEKALTRGSLYRYAPQGRAASWRRTVRGLRDRAARKLGIVKRRRARHNNEREQWAWWQDHLTRRPAAAAAIVLGGDRSA